MIQFKSLPSVGEAVGSSAAGVSSGAGDSVASGSEVPAPSTSAVGVPALVIKTGRNSSFAEALISARVFSSGIPGMETMMFVSPCVVT